MVTLVTTGSSSMDLNVEKLTRNWMYQRFTQTFIRISPDFSVSRGSRCPVIVSSAASLPEVAGEAAIKVDPHDTGSLASSLGRK